MRIIHFINGKTKQITQEEAEILNKRIIEGCGKFQTFTLQPESKTYLFINMEQINYID